MHTQLLRTVSVAALAALATVAAWSAGAAEAPKSIRIGYAISLSGVNAQGAAVTTLPGYDLWVKDVNDKGGIMVKEFGKRIPVEVAAKYDDTSSAETLAAARGKADEPGQGRLRAAALEHRIQPCRPRRSSPSTAIRTSR